MSNARKGNRGRKRCNTLREERVVIKSDTQIRKSCLSEMKKLIASVLGLQVSIQVLRRCLRLFGLRARRPQKKPLLTEAG
jgi:hypothetical protein